MQRLKRIKDAMFGDVKEGGDGRDRSADEKDDRKNERGRAADSKSDPSEGGAAGEITVDDMKKMRREWRDKQAKQLERQIEEGKKVDAVLTERRKKKEEFDMENPPKEIGYGPGSMEGPIAVLEMGKALLFLILFCWGIYISNSSSDLRPCGDLTTATDITYCVLTYGPSNSSGFFAEYQCVASDNANCCSSTSDAAKVASERQGCIMDTSSSAYSCLTSSEFESYCKDSKSCPDSVVSSMNNAFVYYAVTLILFCTVQALRAYGLYIYSEIHYLDFFEPKSYFDKLVLTATKLGTKAEQYLLAIHLLVFAYVLYFVQYEYLATCSDAQNTSGGKWNKPADGFTWGVTCVACISSLFVISSTMRYRLKLRGELYSPQVDGSEFPTCCGYDVSLRDCRERQPCCGQPCCESSIVYTKEYRDFVDTYQCAELWRLANCCSLRYWKTLAFWCIIRPIVVAVNTLFWATLGPCGVCCELGCRYKPWLGI